MKLKVYILQTILHDIDPYYNKTNQVKKMS